MEIPLFYCFSNDEQHVCCGVSQLQELQVQFTSIVFKLQLQSSLYLQFVASQFIIVLPLQSIDDNAFVNTLDLVVKVSHTVSLHSVAYSPVTLIFLLIQQFESLYLHVVTLHLTI